MANWRNEPLDNSHIWAHVFEKLNAHYPGRFRSMGDIADATDAELTAVPRIGRTTLDHLRGLVADAKANNSGRFRGAQ